MTEDANIDVAIIVTNNSKERETYFRGGSMCDNDL